MSRPPAYIFVVRHGKRLDAADRQWHLSSPTPYDPPLTYGGWMQSRTVGARIASILRERATEDELAAAAAAATAAANTDNPHRHNKKKPHKKRLYRVVIHSSPFLRCVQTSIAISAGLASTPFPSATVATTVATTEGVSSGATPSPADPNSPLAHHHASAHDYGKLTVSTNVLPASPATTSPDLSKSVLRLDSFLGEWLSPDYFEHITPPPRSMLMLATAKAELLRRENYNEFPKFVPFSARHSPNASGRLWSAGSGSAKHSSPLASPHVASPRLPSGLENLSGLNDHLHTQAGDAQDYLHHPGSGHRGYMSPVPSYAISTSQPIPQGYVAHARDACVDLDYQWDSTRDNLGWGDGGVLPEEWASMHQRFRKGLRRLIDWYTTSQNPAEMVTKTPTSAESRTKVIAEESDDVIIENVVILVSHGAGCNALVGAITQQPVLADIPMSSITMAQRRSEFDENDPTFDPGFSSLEDGLSRKRFNLSDMYELKLFANTDHLLSNIPRNMTVGRSASLTGPHGSSGGLFSGGTYKSASSRDLDSAYGSSRSHSTNASLGSIRRSPQGASPGLRPVNYTGSNLSTGVTVGGSGATTSLLAHRPVRSGSMGLWQPPKQEHELENEPAGASLPPVFSDDQDSPAPAPAVPIIQTKIPEQPGNSNNDDPARQTTEEENEKQQQQQQQQKEAKAEEEEEDRFDDAVPHLWAGTGNGGLWGAPRPPGEAERLRDFSSTKRRWTVNER